MSRSSRRRKRLERRKRHRRNVLVLPSILLAPAPRISIRFIEQYEVSQPVVRHEIPPRSAVPCPICIKMVADTCRSRGRCLNDAYREGVIARQPGLEHYEAHAGVVSLPVLDPFDWDPHAR